MELFNSITTANTEKRINIQKLLTEWILSNQAKTKMVQILIDVIIDLQTNEIIESKFQLVDKSGIIQEVIELTPSLLTKTNWLYFYEKF